MCVCESEVCEGVCVRVRCVRVYVCESEEVCEGVFVT